MVRGGSSLPVDRSNKGEGRMERCLVPFALRHSHEEVGFVLGRSGNDLLSRVLRHSTIGAEEFNGRVRDGIGFRLLAQITGPAKDNGKPHDAEILGDDPRTQTVFTGPSSWSRA